MSKFKRDQKLSHTFKHPYHMPEYEMFIVWFGFAVVSYIALLG